MKYRAILIPVLGLLFLVIAVLSLSENILSPYVPFATARDRGGSYVQIIGTLDSTSPVIHGEGEFSFRIAENGGAKMDVIHRGVKPQNFEHADQIVLLGSYNISRGIFEADKLLVKCPSKYRSEK
jgi:cytochrome c-type biogenesis protein CcmE